MVLLAFCLWFRTREKKQHVAGRNLARSLCPIGLDCTVCWLCFIALRLSRISCWSQFESVSVRGCSKGANTGSFLTWALFSSLSLFFTSLPLPFFSVSPHSTYLEVFGKRYTAPCFSSFSPPGLLHGRYLDFCAIYPHTLYTLSHPPAVSTSQPLYPSTRIFHPFTS